MGNQNLSQPPTFSQSTNFYDASLVSSDSRPNFLQNDINDILNTSTTTTSTSPQHPTAVPSSTHHPQTSPRTSPTSCSSSPSTSTPASSRIHKRTLNTLAARRYRQKRLDQMQDLETKLKESESEKELLRQRVARLEGEVAVLKGLLRPT